MRDEEERRRHELRNIHARAIMAKNKPSEAALKHARRDLAYYPKPKWGEWVPCKTGRNPKDGSIVLAQISGTSENQIWEKAPVIAAFSYESGWVAETEEPMEEMTVEAWMPLPEPYEGKG